MWLFLSNSMLSIVAPRPGVGVNPAKVVVVRARIKGDIQRVFGRRTKVRADAGTDYRYRATVSRQKVARNPRPNVVERQPQKMLTVLSAGLKPFCTCSGSHGLASSFSAKVTLL